MTPRSTNPSLPKSLNQAEFEAIAAHCFAVTSRAVAKNQEVAPVLLLGRIEGSQVVIVEAILTPTRNEDEKLVLCVLMASLVERPELDFVVLICEAWFLVNPVELPNESMASHPQRTEAVVFNILSKDCQIAVINLLHRNPPRLERGEVDFAIQLAGRMVRETAPPN